MDLFKKGFTEEKRQVRVQMMLRASQKSAIPTTTVPPKDFVFNANIKVGIATQSSGCQRDICRGMPLVTSSGLWQ